MRTQVQGEFGVIIGSDLTYDAVSSLEPCSYVAYSYQYLVCRRQLCCICAYLHPARTNA